MEEIEKLVNTLQNRVDKLKKEIEEIEKIVIIQDKEINRQYKLIKNIKLELQENVIGSQIIDEIERYEKK